MDTVGGGDSLQYEKAGRTGVHTREFHRPHAFVAYTKSLDIFDLMLARMMGTTADGLHDRLMEFSRAVTGATFFVPSLETLSSLKQ